MKKLLALSLLLPFFTAQALEPVNTKITVKSQSSQAKIYNKHQKNWQQRQHGRHVTLYQCYDSWGHDLRGRFTQDEQYFIELGGGSCRKAHNDRHAQTDLNAISHYGFALANVHQAIKQIKYDYGLRQVKMIRAENVDDGYKTFKYTLVFKGRHQPTREFRIKHNRRNGKIRAIYEV
jgi:hypothetical protein